MKSKWHSITFDFWSCTLSGRFYDRYFKLGLQNVVCSPTPLTTSHVNEKDLYSLYAAPISWLGWIWVSPCIYSSINLYYLISLCRCAISSLGEKCQSRNVLCGGFTVESTQWYGPGKFQKTSEKNKLPWKLKPC